MGNDIEFVTKKNGDSRDSEVWSTRQIIEAFGVILHYKCSNCGMEHYSNVLPKSISIDAVYGDDVIDVVVYSNCLCVKCLNTNKVILKKLYKNRPQYYEGGIV